MSLWDSFRPIFSAGPVPYVPRWYVTLQMGTMMLCDECDRPRFYLSSLGKWTILPYARYSPHLFGDAPFQRRRLFITGLPPQTNNQNLYNYFSQFGKIDMVEVRYFRETSDCRGFAFVAYMSINDSDAVLNYKPHIFLNCTLEVRRAARVVEGQEIPYEETVEGFRVNFTFYDIRKKNKKPGWSFRTVQRFLTYIKTFGSVVELEGGKEGIGYVIFAELNAAQRFIQFHDGIHVIEWYGIRTEPPLHRVPDLADDKGLREIFENVRCWSTPPPGKQTNRGQNQEEICAIPGFLRPSISSNSGNKSWNPFYV